MKIFDVILDRLNETALFEMAYNRRKAQDMVTDLSPEIFDHLLKMFVFSSPENKQGWIGELNAWLSKINKIYLKPYSKKLDANTLYNWLIFDSAPHYSEQYVNSVIRKLQATTFKNIPVYDYDSTQVLNEILKILNNVSKDISNNTFTTIEHYLP
jgi:hypothetical protein